MTTTPSTPAASRPTAPSDPGQHARRRPRAGVVVALLAAAWFGLAAVWPAVLTTGDPLALRLTTSLSPPSAEHWLGTDEAGRDLYGRIVAGARPSLAIGLGATAVSLLLALLLGGLAALGPRPVAVVVDRVVEVLFAFPHLLLALLLVALLGPAPVTLALAVGAGTSPGYARLVRTQLLSVRRSAYVEAAVALGHSRGVVLRQHVLPNALRPLVAVMALCVGQSIVWASSLSFLGLGVSPPSSEWGALLEAGRPYLTHAWWLTVAPGLVIVGLALTTTTLGRHLQAHLERTDP